MPQHYGKYHNFSVDKNIKKVDARAVIWYNGYIILITKGKTIMKRIISLAAAAALASSFAVCAGAADKAKGEPDVFVDGSKIIFSDQNAVIVDGRTLVPARGVFEAMGHDVEWDNENRTVEVTSDTGVRTVFITIDSDVMKINTFKSVFEYESKETKLDVPAKIMNDRTMIPLRAVAEAFDSEVNWDGDAYAVNITTGAPILLEGFAPAPETPAEEKVSMKLTSDAVGKELKAGDTFDVYIEVGNLPENYYVSAIVASFKYDKNQFEYVEGSGSLLNNNDEAYEGSSVENTEYAAGAKVFFYTIEEPKARDKDGKVFKATFKALTDQAGSIELENSFNPPKGYTSHLLITIKEKYYNEVKNSGDKAALDKLNKQFDITVDGKDLNLGSAIVIGK